MIVLLSATALADTCESYSKAEELDPVIDKTIDEASGIVELRTRPGVWITHNDAGGVPALYTFTLDGELLETVAILNASHDDWEDIAAGPCPISDGECLFIGDIGDNARDRASVQIYAVPEPAEGETSVQVEATWEATYPDQPADSESLLYHPCTGDLQLITKVSNAPAAIWQFPKAPGKGALTQVAEFDLYTIKLGNYRVTGADWDASGERLVMRTYGDILEWHTDPSDPTGHWAAGPDVQLISTNGQLEAISYSLSGDLVSVSEGEITRIYQWTCKGHVEGEDCPDPDSDDPDSGSPDSGSPDSDDPDSDDPDSDSDEGTTDSGGTSPQDTGSTSEGACGCSGGSSVALLLLPGALWMTRRRALTGHRERSSPA